MRKTAFAGLLICAMVALSSQRASASALDILQSSQLKINISQQAVLEQIIVEKTETSTETAAKATVHTVASGESLEKIAEKYSTSWKRIYFKNTSISNPDVINMDMELVIPEHDEELAERPVPIRVTPTRELSQRASNAPASSNQLTQQYAAGDSSGNRYSKGYCTWYAKSRRPDLPNNLGNANTWAARASAQGIATGSEPRAAAIGQQGMHVVYVESVNGNGTVTVSEMNFEGFGVISSRTVSASNFRYIY